MTELYAWKMKKQSSKEFQFIYDNLFIIKK